MLKNITFKTTYDQVEALEQFSTKYRQPVSATIRQAIDTYLKVEV